ncbi:MAG: GNAT family N-acetyltransferase [Planctomycetes bacterium]|nr:GNAT family N-acetyltransferase [Planctomycetota bacterium]
MIAEEPTDESASTDLEIVSYRASMRDAMVTLWNELFHEQRNFVPMTREIWRARIELANAGEAFEPELLRVAWRDGRAVGFAHGGIWEGEFLRSLLPESSDDHELSVVGHLSLIGVAIDQRGRGLGTRLLASLKSSIELLRGPGRRMVIDGRVYNPFYGNFFAPRPPLWGTTEGAAVPRDDLAARGFLESCGFRAERWAWSVVADPREGELPDEVCDVELELAAETNYQAILETPDGTPYPFPNASRTWVASHGGQQIGSLVVYPFAEADPAASERWGIHALEVATPYRGRGVATRLLGAAMDQWRRAGVREVEALVLPEESPGARRLYAKFGFRDVAEWCIFG